MEVPELVFDGSDGGYARSFGKTTTSLAAQIAKSYGAERALVTCSGMAAIATAVNGLIMAAKPSPTVLLCDRETYCDVVPAFEHAAKIHGGGALRIEIADLADPEVLASRAVALGSRDSALVIYAEDASNPSGRPFPFAAIPRVRETARKLGHRVAFAIDNTWMTRLGVNPIERGADVVVTSLTKHCSGCAAIAGAVIFNCSNAQRKAIERWHARSGAHVSPHDARVVADAHDKMGERLASSTKLAASVLRELKLARPDIDVRAAPSTVAGPSVFLVVVECGDCTTHSVDAALPYLVMRLCPHFALRTSYGGPDCRIDPWGTFMGGRKVGIRASIGYEEKDGGGELAREILALADAVSRLSVPDAT